MNTTIQKIAASKRILGPFIGSPERKFTPHEVSRITSVSYATCWRRLKELAGVGLLDWERIGNYNAYRLNGKSPFLMEAKKILTIESPHRKAALEFTKSCKRIGKIQKIVLFGSVAKGREKATSDVDIAIIAVRTEGLKEKASALASKISEKHHIFITPVFLKPEEANRGRLSKTLKEGEILYERDQ